MRLKGIFMKRVNANYRLILFVLILTSPIWAYAASCTENHINNGGFENPIVPLGGTITKDDGLANDSEFMWSSNASWYLLTDDYMLMTEGGENAAPPEGYQALYFSNGKIYQNTGLIIQENTRYVLKFRLMVTVLNSTQYFFAAFENPAGDFLNYSGSYLPLLTSPYTWSEDINFVFDSAQNPSSVGQQLVVALYSTAYSYIDDVQLYVSPSGDFDDNCTVNIIDVADMADNWLINNFQ
jgi:hypothetical protein